MNFVTVISVPVWQGVAHQGNTLYSPLLLFPKAGRLMGKPRAEVAGQDLTSSGRMWFRLAHVGSLPVALLAQPGSYHRCLHMAEPLDR